MINVLATKGRKLVVIIDPHIKRDNGYSVHREATANGYYVKNKDRNDFEGILLKQFLHVQCCSHILRLIILQAGVGPVQQVT